MSGRSQEQLTLDTSELLDLFDNAPCGYISAHPDGRISRVNQTFADWMGVPLDELSQRRFQDLLNIAGRIYYETHFSPLLRMQGFFHEVALDLVRHDGKSFPVLVNAVERRDDAGGVRFIRITVFNAVDRRRYEAELLQARKTAEQATLELQEMNRTLEARVAKAVEERMAAESALRQAQKMEAVGQLTGGIAHDFNNMLAVVLSGLSLLEKRLSKGETDVQAYVDAARDAANRASTLTQRLLAFSRQQPLAPQPLNANRLVSDMSEILRRTLGETVQLETVLAGGLWKTKADANQLENAIINLAVNARDAMEDGGRLTIETANCHLDDAYATQHAVSAGQYVMVAVTDTGEGMSSEVLSKAFDPFFTTKGVGKGTGLGLSQVFGFVKQSVGHIKIYSELGHGTTVKIYLPRLYGGADVPEKGPRRGVVALSRGETILLVEDDHHVLDITRQTLLELGYSVLTASSGAQALDILRKHPEVQLLFTDVVMPDMNGRQLAQNARKIRPKLKVLYTTGYTRNAIVHNGILDADVAFLQKPSTMEEIAAKIRQSLD